MKYSISAVTDVGMVRVANEDMFLIAGDEIIIGEGNHFEAHTEGEGDFLAVVIDGMGGAEAGAFAARRVREIFNETYQERDSETPLLEVIRKAFQRADEAIKKEGELNSDVYAAAAQVAVLACRGNEAVIAQMCDTAVFLGRNGECLDLFGHSLYGNFGVGLFCGPFPPFLKEWIDEFEGFEFRLNGIGYSTAFSAATVTLQPGDSVLLLSYGIHSFFSTEAIRENLRMKNVREIPNFLIRQFLEENGPYNATAICCRFGEPQGQSEKPLIDSVRFLQFENKNYTHPVIWARFLINGAIQVKDFKGARAVAQTIPEHLGREDVLKLIGEYEERNRFWWLNPSK